MVDQWASTDDHAVTPASGGWASTDDHAVAASPQPAKTVGGFLSNALSSAGRFAGDIGNTVIHPGQMLEGVSGLVQGINEKAGIQNVPKGQPGHASYVDALVKQYGDRYGSWEGLKNSLYTDPVGVAADLATLATGAGTIAKGVEFGADAAKLGTIAKTAGTVARAADAVSSVTDPLRVAGKVADVTGVAGLAGKATDAVSTGLMKGALKGGYSTTAPAEDVANAAKTAKDLSIPVSDSGAAKIGDALKGLQQTVNDKVDRAANAGQTVSRRSVEIPLQELRLKYGAQVNPQSDLAAIDKTLSNFRSGNSDQIPVDRAQALKTGTYQANPEAYGPAAAVPPEMRARVAAEKALAGGLKAELEKAIPELADLNPKEAKLLNLQGVLETAVNKYNNKGGFTGNFAGNVGLRGAELGAGVGLLTHDPVKGIAAAALKGVLSDPVVQSRLAIMVNKAQQLNPGKYGAPNVATALSRVAEYRQALDGQQGQ